MQLILPVQYWSTGSFAVTYSTQASPIHQKFGDIDLGIPSFRYIGPGGPQFSVAYKPREGGGGGGAGGDHKGYYFHIHMHDACLEWQGTEQLGKARLQQDLIFMLCGYLFVTMQSYKRCKLYFQIL